jgi:hypothetical protein
MVYRKESPNLAILLKGCFVKVIICLMLLVRLFLISLAATP